MAEHEVMWIGRRPAAMAPAENPATTEDFAAAITQACADRGCEVQDYIAAAGVYGSWMVRFLREGGKHRILWNGKEGRLVLERAVTAVDWQETRHAPVADRSPAGFVLAVAHLLKDEAPA